MAAAWASANADPTTSTGDTSMVVTAPTGITAGDLLVAFGGCVDSRTISPPSGWTEYSDTAGGSTVYIWWKAADSTDASAGSFTFTASAGFSSAVVSVHRGTGINTSNAPTKAFGTGPNDTSQTTPTITLPSAGCLVFYGVYKADVGAASSSDKGAKRIDVSDGSSGCFMTQYTEVVSGSGSNTGATIVTTVFGAKRTLSVAFEASGGSGVSGTVAKTNANDTSSASGTTTVTGTSAKTNANDTSSASGTTTVIGTSARTNANDTSSASGTTTITGTFARTNANDTGAASGNVGSATGTVSVTNANDTASASGAAVGGNVGHAGGRKRRVIIDDVIYVGTDEQIEAKLWQLVQEQKKPEPVKVKAKRAKKQKPVELRVDYEPIPIRVDMPRFQQLQTDAFRHEDRFMQAMLQRMIERYLDEEDVEILLLHG